MPAAPEQRVVTFHLRPDDDHSVVHHAALQFHSALVVPVSRKQPVSPFSCFGHIARIKRDPLALFGLATVQREVAPPCAVVVLKVMIGIGRIDPDRQLCTTHYALPFRLTHQDRK